MTMSTRFTHNPRRSPLRAPRSGLGVLLVLLAIFVGALGLTHILVKNKTHALTRQQEAVEREIAELLTKKRNLITDISKEIDRRSMADALVNHRSKLKDILKANIVDLSSTEEAP